MGSDQAKEHSPITMVESTKAISRTMFFQAKGNYSVKRVN